jgi:hypothetical protein
MALYGSKTLENIEVKRVPIGPFGNKQDFYNLGKARPEYRVADEYPFASSVE